MKSEKLVIGKIRTSFGIKGYLKVLSMSGELDHFLDLESIELYANGRSLNFKVEDVLIKSGALIMKLYGIETPEEGKKYSGWEIRVLREFAAPLDDGEYYQADLCRCRLFFNDAEAGTVRRVVEGGNGELLEVEKGDGSMVFVPFRNEFIGAVDIPNGKIELLTDWILE